jgi:hypothetical protein
MHQLMFSAGIFFAGFLTGILCMAVLAMSSRQEMCSRCFDETLRKLHNVDVNDLQDQDAPL